MDEKGTELNGVFLVCFDVINDQKTAQGYAVPARGWIRLSHCLSLRRTGSWKFSQNLLLLVILIF